MTTTRRSFIGASVVLLAACAAPEVAPLPNIADPQILGKLSDIPVRGGKVFDIADRKILVTRPSENEIRAFLAKCTHQGGMLSNVSENVISCPLHGAQFDADSGNVVQGPADMALITYSITLDEDGETLVVAS